MTRQPALPAANNRRLSAIALIGGLVLAGCGDATGTGGSSAVTRTVAAGDNPVCQLYTDDFVAARFPGHVSVDEFPDSSSCRFEVDTGGSIVISHYDEFTARDAAERSNPGSSRETSYTGHHPALYDSDEITVALGERLDSPGCVDGTESGFGADDENEAFQTMATLITEAVTELD